MTNDVFLNTNVLLYALSATPLVPLDPRAEIAEGIMGSGGVISVQVLNEFVDVVARKHRRSWPMIEQMLEVIESLCGPAIPLTIEIHSAAVSISKNHGFRIYDSLIVAAAEQASCTTLYTEDLHHGQTIGKVKVVNPFL